eukprot:PITA_04538
MGQTIQSGEIPLQPQVLIEPFERWALDFVGPINPMSKGKKYILVCNNYAMKSVEARALPKATEKEVVDFLFSNIFANGQVESTNKVLETILTKTVQLHKKDWSDQLHESLRAYKITWRNTTSFSPYELVYGKQVLLPIEFQIGTFNMATNLGIDLDEAQQQRILQLNGLDEIRKDSFQHTHLIQQQQVKWHDRYIKKKKFK